MNDYLKYALINIAIIIVAFFCYDRFFSSAQVATNTITKSTIKIYDSTQKVIIPKQAPSIQTFCLVPVPMNVDTAEILRNFFAIYTYSQSIADSNITGSIVDTISQNRILGRKLTYRLIKPVLTIESTTITSVEKNSSFLLGGFSLVNKNQFAIGPQASVLFKNNLMVNAGYDFINRGIFFGAQIKLHARRNH